LLEWGMTRLELPDPALHASWAAAVREYREAGEEHMHGSGMWEFDEVELSEAGCRAVVTHLAAQADPATELPEDKVHCTYFWITDGGEFVGYLALRHALTPWLFEEGGHIGYSVRPSRRREGHAVRALVLALAESAALGLDRVLVTCDEDNDGSRRVIERAGGVMEDVRQGKRRYWIDTEVTAAGSGPRSAGRGEPA
jgi:predicted acetyltransferase